MPARKGRTPVVLNVYDLVDSNIYTEGVGIGAYHTGVEIAGEEYTFSGGSGIFSHTPRRVEGAKFRKAIEMGYYEGSYVDARSEIFSMNPEFPGSSYNVLTRNCNCFSDEVCVQLLGVHIPSYINRLAYFGSFLSCLLPPSISNASPSDSNNSAFQQVSNGRTAAASKNQSTFSGSGMVLGSSSAENFNVSSRREQVREATLRRMQQYENKSSKAE